MTGGLIWLIGLSILSRKKYSGCPLSVTPQEGRRVIAVIETTEKSAHKGRELPVPGE